MDKILIFPASFVRFLLVGIVNTAVGLSVIYSVKFLGARDVAANIAGYAVGVVVSFTLNKRWTFDFSGGGFAPFLRFLAVFAVAYAVNLATVLGLIGLGVNSYLSQALGTMPYTLLFYIGSREFAFRSRE